MNKNTKIASIIVGIVVIIFIIVAVTNKGQNSDDLDVNVASSTDVTGSSTTKTPGSVSTSTPAQTTKPVVSKKADDSKATTAGIEEAVFANNEFALNMYVQLAKAEKGNIFFSPYSITTALGMIYEGARGTTSDEIANVLLNTDPSARRAATARIYNEMNAVSTSYTLKTANALWAEKSYPIAAAYLKTVDTYYKGGATSLDFRSNTDKSRVTINNWVENQTNGKIKELIPYGALSSDTRLVLTNAIYFKGKWTQQFNKADTKKTVFHITATTTALADMMSMYGGKEFNYASSTAGQIIELPYAGGKLSMLIVLDRGTPMTSSDVSRLKDAMTKQKVNVFVPRFKTETKYTLNDALIALGMPTAFLNTADFTGMSAGNALRISKIFHKTFIEVNEEGTEAAAATGGIMTTTSAPVTIPEFKADHPFLFMIRDIKTDEIIFMGRVVNPNL